jgi:hypothetical protein
MNYVWILGGLGLASIAIMLIHERGYSQGKQDGEKSGYERGFREGHAAADQWWLSRDFEVREAEQKIRDEERWP